MARKRKTYPVLSQLSESQINPLTSILLRSSCWLRQALVLVATVSRTRNPGGETSIHGASFQL